MKRLNSLKPVVLLILLALSYCLNSYGQLSDALQESHFRDTHDQKKEPVNFDYKNHINAFSADGAKQLERAYLQITQGQGILHKAQSLQSEANAQRILAERTNLRRWQKRQSEKKAQEIESEVVKYKEEAYSFLIPAQKVIYDVYAEHIDVLQSQFEEKITMTNDNRTKLTRIRNYKRQAARAYRQADSYTTNRQRNNKQTLPLLAEEHHQLAQAIDAQGNALRLLLDDNYISPVQRQQIKNRLDQAWQKVNSGENAWLEEVDKIYLEIRNLNQDMNSTEISPDLKIYMARQLLNLEELAGSKIKITLDERTERNQQRFRNYLNEFNSYDNNMPPAKRAHLLSLEDNMIKEMNLAKNKLEQAYLMQDGISPQMLILEADVHENKATGYLEEARKLYADYEAPPVEKTDKEPAPQKKSPKSQNKQARNTNPTYTPKKSDGTHFSIQIGAFAYQPPKADFKGYTAQQLKVEKMPTGRLYAVITGEYSTMPQAESALKQAQEKGYKDAYIIEYQEFKRITDNPAMTNVNTNSNTTNKPTKPPSSEVSWTKKLSKSKNAKDDVIKGININYLSGLVYTVQLGYSDHPLTYGDFNNIHPIYEDRSNARIIRYTTGLYASEAAATKAQKTVSGYGIKGAFVTAYYNGQRLSLDQARKKSASKQAPQYNPPSQQNTTNTSSSTIEFSVQVLAYKGAIPKKTIDDFKKTAASRPIDQRPAGNGMTALTIGRFNNYKEAVSAQKQIAKDVADSFVVAYRGQKKLVLDEAIKQAAKH